MSLLKQIAPRTILFLSLVAFIGMGLPDAYAQVDTFEFESAEQQKRFRKLSDEFRCPMCQNTSLSGSTGGVAEDLRREVHRMIVEGMSDEEIEQFMFDRYGDFIFYKPRLTSQTVLLWFGPLLFLLLGAIVLINIWRKAGKLNSVQVSDELDGDDRRRLENLLAESRAQQSATDQTEDKN